MVCLISKVGVAALASLVAVANAHPGEHHDEDLVSRQIHARNHWAAEGKRSLGQCSSTNTARDVRARAVSRRAETVKQLRAERGIDSAPMKYRRDLATLEAYEAVDHNMTGKIDAGIFTPEDIVFGANTSCILTPEVTDGPYYVTGELIRQNVKEHQYSEGIDMFLEVQYVDVETCKPIPGIFVDIWQANATGVYSGISVSGNYAADGWNSTYLRGIQVTDIDGVASFRTIFPGHYDERATHTHLLAHMNVTQLPNSTIANGNVTHIGQLFWNEELRNAVEETYPYNTNTQAITTNEEDMWSIVQAENDYDPFPEYMYIGSNITDGLFAWIQIAVNTTADYTDNSYYTVAAYYQADGGHENVDSAANGGGSM